MGRLKNLKLKKSFFFLTSCGLALSLILSLLLWLGCGAIASQYPSGGVAIEMNGTFTPLPTATPEQLRLRTALELIRLAGCVFFPVLGLSAAATLFYRWKLEQPIVILTEGTRRIRAHDLDFNIPAVSADELGQVCAAFEIMRQELLKTNRELWRQAEERKRLNAAFAHDLRNPITVLKGSVKLLRQGTTDKQVLDRLESYTLRIEKYVEMMSSIQRLEQMPIRTSGVSGNVLREELEETVRLLASTLKTEVSAFNIKDLEIDHGLFLTVAENIIGNAARFARKKIEISLTRSKNKLSLTVSDDGQGFPEQLLSEELKPFRSFENSSEHFGMGLYSSRLLCVKHGGELRLKNKPEGGAMVAASFRIE